VLAVVEVGVILQEYLLGELAVAATVGQLLRTTQLLGLLTLVVAVAVLVHLETTITKMLKTAALVSLSFVT
tara:strand:- start:20 stop:232 length:213 start_codon:yes stop_codon:yes gene_type:complete